MSSYHSCGCLTLVVHSKMPLCWTLGPLALSVLRACHEIATESFMSAGVSHHAFVILPPRCDERVLLT